MEETTEVVAQGEEEKENYHRMACYKMAAGMEEQKKCWMGE